MDDLVPREKALIAYDLTHDFFCFLKKDQVDTLKEQFGVKDGLRNAH